MKLFKRDFMEADMFVPQTLEVVAFTFVFKCT